MLKIIILLGVLGGWAFLSWYATKHITTKIAIKKYDKSMDYFDSLGESDLKMAKMVNDWYESELKKEGLEDEDYD